MAVQSDGLSRGGVGRQDQCQTQRLGQEKPTGQESSAAWARESISR